ncbi:MAG TPA: alpha/beta fold hydrolase, partial [Mycobacteriales bacterium]|nr:alpha/beta fold hydrolase [Mycobacteriales bacterium]
MGSVTLPVQEDGDPAGEAVVLLHGFPQTPAAWDRVRPALAAAGYRVLVPAQRGYPDAPRPAGRRGYRTGELVGDVLALLDRHGVDRAHLVGHDWGAAVAWAVAAAHPDRLRSLTAVSVPHPRALTGALLTSTQALRSWYILLFQAPWLPEQLLLAGDGR